MSISSVPETLRLEYELRFAPLQQYRNRVWKILTAKFFQQHVPQDATVLDLGSGWGEFINNIRAGRKYAMDLNPEGAERVGPEVTFLHQDCSDLWAVPDGSLDVVFTSNFFEHLPTKGHLSATLAQAHRCLKPGGTIICMGPNINCVHGRYWDFWDHHIPLTDKSLAEALRLSGFDIERCLPRFLPYTMVDRRPPPVALVGLYLKLPLLWRFLGEQFLVFATTGSRAVHAKS